MVYQEIVARESTDILANKIRMILSCPGGIKRGTCSQGLISININTAVMLINHLVDEASLCPFISGRPCHSGKQGITWRNKARQKKMRKHIDAWFQLLMKSHQNDK